MVTTRRSAAGVNAVPSADDIPKPTKRRKITSSTIPKNITNSSTNRPLGSKNLFLVTSSPLLVKPDSEPSGSTITSLSSGRALGRLASNQLRGPLTALTRPAIIPAKVRLQRPTATGSFHNPIELIEDPPRASPRDKSKEHIKTGPHQFRNRYSKLYTYKAPVTAQYTRLANESESAGQTSHDLYRKSNVKVHPSIWSTNRDQLVPLEMQLPLSTQYLKSSTGTGLYPPKPFHYYAAPPIYPQRTTPTPVNEDQLRRKASQYIQEYSRSSWPKSSLTKNPDRQDKAGPETQSPRLHHANEPTSRPEPVPKHDQVTILPDPHFQLAPLIHQTSLLTSLLRAYPQSPNQQNLRHDIALLASVQHQHLTDWVHFEAGQCAKTVSTQGPRGAVDAPTQCDTRHNTRHNTCHASLENTVQRTRDEEIRSVLAANAALWQDGSGMGLAEVFAEGGESSTSTCAGGE